MDYKDNIYEEQVQLINKALNIELYPWQKMYIFGNPEDVVFPTERRSGRTTAYILRLLLSESEPLLIYRPDVLKNVIDAHYSSVYYEWFRHEVHYIYQMLRETKVRPYLRPVYFSHHAYMRGEDKV